MMASTKQWVTEAISSTGWVWGPLLAVYAPRGLSSMYFNNNLRRYARRLVPFLDPFVSIDIVFGDHHQSCTRGEGFCQSCNNNNAYKEVEAYLTKKCTRDANAFCAEGTVRGDSFLLSLRNGQEVTDNFQGVTVWWLSTTTKNTTEQWKDITCLRLMFPQQRRALILDQYLPHVRRRGRKIMIGKRSQRLYSNRGSGSYSRDTISSWSHIDFVHPTTFDTLAMHPDKKREIIDDLDNFRRNKDYYRRIGKPWQRGYLLYGPPGTGKSTMIAAMANYLNYDIYDMELTSVSKNCDLRRLLVEIPGKSITVFEDIDCCFDNVTSQRSNQERRSTLSRYYNAKKDDDISEVTLSGLLNFIDGVWSAQTSERIIVFTTNFSDKLDQALIRSGRMDMHIEMSYCCFEAFQTIAENYLGVREHPLFQRVQELLKAVEITPADVAECFLRSQTKFAGSDCGVEMEACIRCLIDELEKKAAEPKKRRLVPFVTIDIVDDKDSIHRRHTSDDLKLSEAFEEVKAYLSSACSRDALDLYAHGTVRGDSFMFGLRMGEEVADSFSGVTLRWSSQKSKTGSGSPTTCYRLMFPQQHRALILDEYLPHVRRKGRDIKLGKRGLWLYSNRRTNRYDTSSSWSHIDFEHPTTFNTLAMHPNKKRKIMEDLNNFCRNKDYYHRIGKPWKRGYLLYGPPGTGKSTMIAAMANHLKYDVYDVELTSVFNNSDLRSLLIGITGKSIVVFEDIDCCFDDVASQRSNKEGKNTLSRYTNDDGAIDKSKVTLSGLLNFIDGVWSAQTGERIIVFTTNFPDKLDEALIRSGRMDIHIEMSYCCFEAFQMLAKNYLGVEAHPLFQRVEELLQVVEITPADVAECFLRSQSDLADSDRGVETSIGRLVDELEKRKAAFNELEKKAAPAQPQPKKRRRRRY